MDGLDDQADAVVEGIIDQLFTTNNETVTIKHSSRDSLMLRITTALKDPQKVQNFCTKKLIFRSGISVNGLRWLEEALIGNDMAIAKRIEELEFVGLQNKLTLEGVLLLTRRLNIKKLSLTTYGSRSQTSRIDRDLLAHTIRSGLLLSIQNHTLGSLVVDGVAGAAVIIESNPKSEEEDEMKLESFSLTGYPLGSKGIEIVFEAVRHYSKCLKTLKLIDCDLRSDSNMAIANLIKSNPNIECMDLSHNRHYPGSSVQREMTIKTLVKRGLVYNMNLLELKMENTTNRPPPSSPQLQRLQRHVTRVNQNSSSTKKLSLIDRQLATNRFCKRLIQNSNEEKDDDRQRQQQKQEKEQKNRCWDPTSIHPHIYSHVLAHVSSKPSALYLFLQESIPTLFPH